MIVGTAGHIDHGKSALVEALTGVHPDRLAEERRRGMTLDLGFGHWSQNGQTIGVVDVPGHERFIHSMLAGAGGIDVMLLVVAADAGVQPQTVEHFAICRLLGIPQGVVALTKTDLADGAQMARVRSQIAALLEGTAFAGAPVIPVSAVTGAGIEELRQALLTGGGRAPGRDAAAPFRLPVDRAFSMKGFGAVITGTLAQGTLHTGEEAELLPGRRRVRVRGLQVHGQAVTEAVAGNRVAANLAGVETRELHRGLELMAADTFAVTQVLDIELSWVVDAPVLPHRADCRVHLHTAEAVATLIWLEAPRYAQLRLVEPVVAAPGDRLILRQLSPAATLAGGVVLDPAPPRYRRADYAGAARHLAELAAAPDLSARLRLWLEGAGRSGCDLAELARRSGRRVDQVRAALAATDCVLSENPPAALATSALPVIERELLAALDTFHRREPMSAGAALDALSLADAPHWLAAAAGRLVQGGKLEIAGGSRYRLQSAAPARGAEQLRLRAAIEEHFRGLGWSAPPLAETLRKFPQPGARALVADLAREHVLTECQPGWFLHAAALDRLRALLGEHKTGKAEFSVGDFKQWTGLSRKLAIPLLEYCDRVRLTRRAGEARIIL
ncbi:MAG: selenocysteine-specific translation elongation factor [Acidobacteria bacterium]|nr:MAG: selenocysteine-specific translation elongation factor [Acidobacteriota bacterium]